MNLVQYFLAFMIFSFVGWLYESILYTIQEKKWISSGFLFGPYCPIYGGGAVAMVFVFYGRVENTLMLFFGGMILATVLEYITAVVIENCFHKKWWDYSKIKFNFQGRICLLGAVAFGTMCMLLCKFIQPSFEDIINKIPENVQFWSAVILAIVFLIDYIITVMVLRKKKKLANEKGETYENQLPQLNMGKIFESVGLTKVFKSHSEE